LSSPTFGQPSEIGALLPPSSRLRFIEKSPVPKRFRSW
jgi:hypothetical protein